MISRRSLMAGALGLAALPACAEDVISFRIVTGVTPHQWIIRARLRDAATRLLRSDEPITDIALDVGFDDLSNFIRGFRREFGLSPRSYRMVQASNCK